MKNYKLAISIIEATQDFILGQIKIKRWDNMVVVWSVGTKNECFYNTDIIRLLPSCYSHYVGYDENMGKCILVVF